MNINIIKSLRGFLVAGAMVFTYSTAHALTITGSGVIGGANVSASATFTTSGNNLLINLDNTTSGGTPTKTQVLTGILFTINGANPTLSLPGTGTALEAGSALYTDATHSSTSADLNGSYQLLGNPGGVLSQSFQYEYGLSSTGAGGLFPANQFTKGGGGDDYGIVANGTDLSQNSFSNEFPYAKNGVTFTLNGFGTVGLNQITNVAFMFGSDGTGIVAGMNTPEPGATALLVGSGVAGTLMGIRRKIRR